MSLQSLTVSARRPLSWILWILIFTIVWGISFIFWQWTFIFTEIYFGRLTWRGMRNIWFLMIVWRLDLIHGVVWIVFFHLLGKKLMWRKRPFFLIFLHIRWCIFISWEFVSDKFIKFARAMRIFRRMIVIKIVGRFWRLTVKFIEFIGLFFLETVTLWEERFWSIDLFLELAQQIYFLFILVWSADVQRLLFTDQNKFQRFFWKVPLSWFLILSAHVTIGWRATFWLEFCLLLFFKPFLFQFQ